MDFHKVKINATPTGYGTTIEIDGTPIYGVTEIRFSASANGVSELAIKIICDAEIEGDALVTYLENV